MVIVMVLMVMVMVMMVLLMVMVMERKWWSGGTGWTHPPPCLQVSLQMIIGIIAVNSDIDGDRTDDDGNGDVDGDDEYEDDGDGTEDDEDGDGDDEDGLTNGGFKFPTLLAPRILQILR